MQLHKRYITTLLRQILIDPRAEIGMPPFSWWLFSWVITRRNQRTLQICKKPGWRYFVVTSSYPPPLLGFEWEIWSPRWLGDTIGDYRDSVWLPIGPALGVPAGVQVGGERRGGPHCFVGVWGKCARGTSRCDGFQLAAEAVPHDGARAECGLVHTIPDFLRVRAWVTIQAARKFLMILSM